MTIVVVGEGYHLTLQAGLDTYPIVVPIQEVGGGYHRSLSNLPNLPPVCGAPKERLTMSWWGNEIRLWRFARRQPEIDGTADREKTDMLHAKRLVARMLMQVNQVYAGQKRGDANDLSGR